MSIPIRESLKRANVTFLFRFVPRQWLRWAAGFLGLGEKYDVITLDLKPEYLEEAKKLPNEKIIIDSTFAFDDAKQAYERLVRTHELKDINFTLDRHSQHLL